MQSNLSKGLFHRGIAQSGTNLAPWGAVAHAGIARERAVKLSEMMGCPLFDSNFEEMIKCLKQVPAKNITEAFYDFFKWDTDPMVPFPPVIEHVHEGAFITENPRFVTKVHGNDIPFMTGLTSEEGVLKTGALIYNQELTADLLKNWNLALPVSLYYDHHSIEKQEEITRQIDEFYFKNQKLNTNTQSNLTDLWTDAWFMHAMMDYLKIRFSTEHKNTFVYYFIHKGSASFSEIFKAGSETYYGTAHAEELQYLFPIRKDLHYFFSSIPSAADKKLTKIFTKLWVNFAYTGNPTVEEVEGQKWQPTSKFPLDYMRIGDEQKGTEKLLSMESDLLAARANFWSELKAHFPASKLSDSMDKKSNVKGEL
jgi:carboxylesterase type B